MPISAFHPILHALILAEEWDSVEKRLVSNPKEISQLDLLTRSTALHVACKKYAPLNIIQGILQNAENSNNLLKKVNCHGKTALHVALAANLPREVIIEMLCLSSSDKDSLKYPCHSFGKLPLHRACERSNDFDVICFLADLYPMGLHVLDFDGKSPIMYYMEAATNRNHLQSGDRNTVNRDDGNDTLLFNSGILIGKAFKVLVDLVDEQDTDAAVAPTLLHKAVMMLPDVCPPVLVEEILKAEPHSIFVKNMDGNLPLHLSFSSRVILPSPRILTSSKDRHCAIIQTLIDMNPRACFEQNNHGRLPIHLALENGLQWSGVAGSLIRSAPNTLMEKDGETHLLPFMIAAAANKTYAFTVNKGEVRESNYDASVRVNTIFELLRALPCAID